MSEKLSEKLKTLLLAYNLCKASIDTHNLFKDWVDEALFHASVVAFYSVAKSEDTKPRDGSQCMVRRQVSTRGGNFLEEIFEEFRQLRNKNIAHREGKGRKQDGSSWLEIPTWVGGYPPKKEQPGTHYVYGASFVKTTIGERNRFLTLIECIVDLQWRNEGHGGR